MIALLLRSQRALSILSHTDIPGVLPAGVCGTLVNHSDLLECAPGGGQVGRFGLTCNTARNRDPAQLSVYCTD